MLEKVEVQELATMLADPRAWIERVSQTDAYDLDSDASALYQLAAQLVKNQEEAKRKEYVEWCNRYNLNANTNEVSYLYNHLLPAVVLCREIMDDYRAHVDELESEIDELKRTLKAVEQTQQLHNDRLNLVVP